MQLLPASLGLWLNGDGQFFEPRFLEQGGFPQCGPELSEAQRAKSRRVWGPAWGRLCPGVWVTLCPLCLCVCWCSEQNGVLAEKKKGKNKCSVWFLSTCSPCAVLPVSTEVPPKHPNFHWVSLFVPNLFGLFSSLESHRPSHGPQLPPRCACPGPAAGRCSCFPDGAP